MAEVNVFKRFQKDLDNAVKMSINQKMLLEVARIGVNIGVAFSPVKKGNLVKGWDYWSEGRDKAFIRNVALKHYNSPLSPFPYNFWINEDIKDVRMMKSGGKKMSYRQTRNTGMPRFFDMMVEKLDMQFDKIAFRKLENGIEKMPKKYKQTIKIK